MRRLFAQTCLLLTSLLSSSVLTGQTSPTDRFYDYKAARCAGEIPVDFRKKSSEKAAEAKDAIRKSKATRTDKKQEAAYAESSSFAIDALLSSGQVLFGDSMSLYVEKVATRLLEANGEDDLLNELRFYVLKSPVPNAYCTSNGAVLISIGLLSRLENEAQLAFILAHEIQHYKLKHSLNAYKKVRSLKTASADRRVEDILAEIYNFSKEHETEADEKGFEMMKKAGYNLDEGVYVFDMLKYTEYPFLEITLPIDSFETASYKFPESFRKYVENEVQKGIKADEKHLEEMGNDDNETHPSLDRRINNLRSMIEKDGDQKNKPVQFFGNNTFENISRTARHELLLLYLRYADFGNAFYLAMVMEKLYGNSLFLAKAKAMSVYGLAHHKALSHNLDNFGCDISKSRGDWRPLISMLRKMDLKELSAFGSKQMYLIKQAHRNDPFIDKLARQFFRIVQEEGLIHLADFTIARPKTATQSDTAVKVEEPEPNNGIKNPRNRVKRTVGSGSAPGDYYMMIFADIEDREYLQQLMKEMEYLRPEKQTSEVGVKSRKNSKLKPGVDRLVIFPPQIELSYGSNQKRDLYQEEDYRDLLSNTWEALGKRANVDVEVLKTNIGEDIRLEDINNQMALYDWMIERLNNDTHSMVLYNSTSVAETMKNKDTRYVGYINYEYSSARKKFNAGALLLSAVVYPVFPYYLVWQLSVDYKFREVCVVFDTETGSVMHLRKKVLAGRLRGDMMNAQIYQTLYTIKHGK